MLHCEKVRAMMRACESIHFHPLPEPMNLSHAIFVLTSARMAAGMTSRARRPTTRSSAG
jgi:hypothetical protein